MSIPRIIAAAIAALSYTPGSSSEICGLKNAITDSIFLSGFNSPSAAGGIGPAISTVRPPTLGIAPTVTIVEPAAGATVGSSLQISGTYTGSTNTGIVVNGAPVYVHDGTFVSQPVTLSQGATEISVVATTMDGLSAATNRSVTVSNVVPEITLYAKAYVGFSPLPTQFILQPGTTLAVQSVSVDFQTDGNADYIGATLEDIPQFIYNQPGAYTATATVTFHDGHQASARQTVIALDLTTVRENVCSVYAHLRARLAVQDLPGAKTALTSDLAKRLIPALSAVGPRLPDVAAKLGVLSAGMIGLETADLVMVREVNMEIKGYPIQFERDAYGVWRINGI